MSTINNEVRITRKVPFDEIGFSEYCSLNEADSFDHLTVSYNEDALSDAMAKMAAANFGYDLSVDVSELFEVTFHDEDGNSFAPKCHATVNAKICTYFGETVSGVMFRSQSKFYEDDWAEFRLEVEPQEAEEEQTAKTIIQEAVGIDAICAPVTREQFAAITSRFDCFVRADVGDEVILDCTCFDEDDDSMAELSSILGSEIAEEWRTQVVLAHCIL